MTEYLPRSAWTRTPAAGSPMPRNPEGVAVHWPAEKSPIGTDRAKIARLLESFRRYHTVERGWSDLAYQVGFDQAGRVWELRGIDRQSAANGSGSTNKHWLAALFLVGPGEAPSPALLAAWHHWRTTRCLKTYPTATRVVGHRDVRPDGTDCPGPLTYALIRRGALTATPSEEDPLGAITDPEQAAQLSRADVNAYEARKYLGIMEARLLQQIATDRPDLDEAAIIAGVTAGLVPFVVDALGERAGLSRDDVVEAIRSVYAQLAEAPAGV